MKETETNQGATAGATTTRPRRNPRFRGAALLLAGILVLSIVLIKMTAQAPLQSSSPQSSGQGDPEKGRYLAIAGNCHACHTSDPNQPLAGGVKFETPFGIVFSRNITPHPTAGIGAWSEQAFIRSMHEGTSANGEHLYPVFPYPSYANVTEEDVRHIFAYLQSAKQSDYRPPGNKLAFPFKHRELLGVWKLMFLNEQPLASEQRFSESMRGEYLVEGLAHCGACHTPRNLLGAEIVEKAMTGGVVTSYVEGLETRAWSAVNLTSAGLGLASWSEDELVEYLKTGYSMTRAMAFGPMTEVISHSTQHLSIPDLQAMVRYLKRLQFNQSEAPSQVPERASMELGALIYDARCGTCHLPTGLGDPGLAPPLSGSAIAQAENPASLINLIVYGGRPSSKALLQRPASLRDDFEYMPSLGSELDPEEIAIVATYIRNSWGNRGAPVTVEQVEQQY
jgi:mono/diheme cytochrome c family protein